MEQDSAPTGFYDHLPRMTRRIRRNAYTRKTGTKVRARMISDVGAPGKWRAEHMGAPGIGKMKEGLLKAVGYDVNAKTTRRRAAVKRAVKKYGRSSTIKKLNAVAVYTRRTSPAKSKTFKADMRAAQKMKGGSELGDILSELAEVSLGDEEMLAPAAIVKRAKSAGVATSDAPKVGDLINDIKSAMRKK